MVDDASTDDTPAIMEQLVADNARVRFARNASSLGPGGARNRGVQLAEGDLLAFCDDDDRLLPGALATMVEFLDQHAECGAVSAWHEVEAICEDAYRTVAPKRLVAVLDAMP